MHHQSAGVQQHCGVVPQTAEGLKLAYGCTSTGLKRWYDQAVRERTSHALGFSWWLDQEASEPSELPELPESSELPELSSLSASLLSASLLFLDVLVVIIDVFLLFLRVRSVLLGGHRMNGAKDLSLLLAYVSCIHSCM